jgi:hypothetical protein
MVNQCANPRCGKPLRYLREGRIFVFEVQDDTLGSDGKRTRHMEHYWLCGDCAPTLLLDRKSTGLEVMPRPAVHVRETPPLTAALAS